MSTLEEIKARAGRATPGPWEAQLSFNREWMLILANSGTADEDHIGKVADDDDAEFIAHARTDVLNLLAALEAVEALHVRWDAEEFYNDSDGGSRSTIVYYCGTCVDGNEVPYAWPCPTIAAIKEALQ